MFGLGTGELVVILAIVVVLFGANKLPQLGEGMGKALRGFKRAVNDNETDKTDAKLPPPGDTSGDKRSDQNPK